MLHLNGGSWPVLRTGWFFIAVSIWIVVMSVAIANATPVPVTGTVVACLLAAVGLVYGAVSRRWFLSSSLVLITLGAGVAMTLDVPGLQLDYERGPAALIGVRVIWVAVATIMTALIAYAVWLERPDWRTGWVLAASDRADLQSQQLVNEQLVTALQNRVTTVEVLLSPDDM